MTGSPDVSSGTGGVGPGTTGWTVDTAVAYLLSRIDSAYHRLDSKIDINDRRYSERFESSQTALTAALVGQEKAVSTAFSAQRDQVNAALAAADRAVSKAEVASEKRFEGVNEFRSQLGDQQRTLMPRAEAEIVFNGLRDRITSLEGQASVNAGSHSGSREALAWIVGSVGIVSTVLVVIFEVTKH